MVARELIVYNDSCPFYSQILESSQTLLHVLKRESTQLKDKSSKPPAADTASRTAPSIT